MHHAILEALDRGRVAFHSGDYLTAEREFQGISLQGGNFADALNMQGLICHSRGEAYEAIKYFERSLQTNPNYSEALLNLSIVYADVGETDKAQELYDRAVSQARNEPDSIDPLAKGKIANLHAQIADTYMEWFMYDEAIREYRRALAIRPGFADIRVKLGLAYREGGYLPQALAEFARAKKDRPRMADAAVNLGVTYFSLGEVEKAKEQWKEVLEGDAANAPARRYLELVNSLEKQ